ncbi:MAG: sugar transferase [Rhodobacteraceae bacterium PARR1]|nr:MAG: sugar transferase [Rhodobacteraceae bacterium PARR1]
MLKRLLDILVAAAALLLLSPVILMVWCMVRAKIGSPVLFRQDRPGLHAQTFRLCKFRTMSDARDANGDLLPDEARLGPFGIALRRWSLDELPQLWNVLVGDMSLVGPRPLLVRYLARYTPRQARRHEVKPGITGWAQINGRNALTWDQKFELDLWYVEHQSLALDLRIIALTVGKVLRRSDVSADSHATMPEFMGTQSEKLK